MARTVGGKSITPATAARPKGRASALIDTRVIYCGDNLEQLPKLPDACVDLIYTDPGWATLPRSRDQKGCFGSAGASPYRTKEKRAFEDRHASTQAYTDYMRPRHTTR